MAKEDHIEADETLDLITESCPMNFVRAKLKLEQMEKGKVLAVLLAPGEAMKNVPGSVRDEGHEIAKVEKDGENFKLYIKKQ